MMQCENAELVAVMEITPELAESCRAKWNCKKAYTTAEDLLNDPEIDAVYIASPVFLHAQQAMAAADAGKHILIEKPLAMTAAEGQKVVEHCKEKGVLIAAGFMMRFGACIQAMKKAIAEGKIGKPVSAYAQFTCWYPDIPGAWRQKKTQGGGGALVDMGVHCIDLLQYVLGSKTAEVAAMHGTQTFHYEVDDSSTVLMRMQNGCQCVVQSNFNIPDNAAKWRLEVFGELTMVLIGVIYIIFRSMGKYLGAHFSAKAVGCDEKTVKYLGITLLPQAGVALGMCVSAQALGAADGLLVRNIVLFSVLIYELVGPLLTKEALTAAGEITAKPREVLERRAKALAEAEPKEFLEEREAKKHKKQDL